MSHSVHVTTLRLHTARNGPRDGRAAVRALGLSFPGPDRSVLVIRRLRVTAGRPRATTDAIAAVLRQARRPARQPVEPNCPAVVFTDEVEAMACLTADLLAGRAGDRWYWPAAVRAGSTAAGTTLTRLWLDRPRWVPATLAQLARSSPADAVRAVALLSDAQAHAVLGAVLVSFGGRVPPPGMAAPGGLEAGSPEGSGDPNVPGWPLGPAADWVARHTGQATLPPAGRGLLTLGLTLAGTPSAVRGGDLERVIGRLLARPATGPYHGGAIRVVPVPRRAGPSTSDHTVATGRADPDQAGPDQADPDQAGPDQAGPDQAGPDQAGPVATAARADMAGRPGVGHPDHDRRTYRWAEGGCTAESRFATLFYAVNLMTRLELPRIDGPTPVSGWATLEALGTWLLRPLSAGQRRDPLWAILAELDGRDPGIPTPVRLGTLTRRVRRLLDRHHLSPQSFARPGTIVVGRTHLDLVLSLDQIDLAARVSGLDQDPGWVPALGRIISFHFDGGA